MQIREVEIPSGCETQIKGIGETVQYGWSSSDVSPAPNPAGRDKKIGQKFANVLTSPQPTSPKNRNGLAPHGANSDTSPIAVVGVSAFPTGWNIRTCGGDNPESLGIDIPKNADRPRRTFGNAYTTTLAEADLLFKETVWLEGRLGND